MDELSEDEEISDGSALESKRSDPVDLTADDERVVVASPKKITRPKPVIINF